MNSRGRQPTVGRAKWLPALEGPNSPPATFDPCRVGSLLERDYRGLHPRLFTFKPSGLAGLPARPHWKLTRPARVRSIDLVRSSCRSHLHSGKTS